MLGCVPFGRAMEWRGLACAFLQVKLSQVKSFRNLGHSYSCTVGSVHGVCPWRRENSPFVVAVAVRVIAASTQHNVRTMLTHAAAHTSRTAWDATSNPGFFFFRGNSASGEIGFRGTRTRP
jgi:hypothetical protein